MKASELRAKYCGRTGKIGDVPVICFDAWYKVILHDKPLGPMVKLQCIGADIKVEASLNEVQWDGRDQV